MAGLISVIVPVYNVREYLEYCVSSICNQTYRNLELILVDDGSTDGSSALCDKLAETDSRIRVVHQNNMGAAGARNSGLDAASGEYISIIDGDDYIWPEMYETLQRILEETKTEFVCCPYEMVTSQEIPEKDKRITQKEEVSLLDRKAVYKHLFDYHTMWVIQPNKLYRSSLFEAYRFPTGHFYEDEYAAHRLLKNVQSAAYVNIPFYRYYRRIGSATKRGVTSRQIDLLDALLDRMAYFKEEGEADCIPVAERCFFAAYRSVAVEMEDRTRISKRKLRQIRKRYLTIMHQKELTGELSAKNRIKRYFYILIPRTMETIIQWKNR